MDSNIENNDDAIHKDWIWLGMSTFSTCVSADNELATCSIHSTDDLYNDSKQTIVNYRFILKKVICTQVTSLLIIFIDLPTKCTISIFFFFFLVFLSYVMLSHSCVICFPQYLQK